MAVILFKKGTGAAQKFDEYSFEHSLENDWCLTKEKALEPEVIELEPEEQEELEEIAVSEEKAVDITTGMGNKEIRAMAKEAGIKNYKKARINKLKEALNDAQS
jgi:hypothetical protein